MSEAGQKPVVLSREIEGFALNRIQYAILSECWRLIDAGILSVKDIDSVMSDGLGPRYAFLGPMETAHLNAEGMQLDLKLKFIPTIAFLTSIQNIIQSPHSTGYRSYSDRYSKTMNAVCATMGPTPVFGTPKVVDNIAKQLEEMCPLEDLEKRRAWRDMCLTQLSQLKKKIDD